MKESIKQQFVNISVAIFMLAVLIVGLFWVSNSLDDPAQQVEMEVVDSDLNGIGF